MFSPQNTLVSPSLITWIWISMSQKFFPKQLRHLVSFPGTWLLHLGVLRKLHTKLWFSLNYSMQHPFGALTPNFRLIRLRKFRGQQPAGPAGDGESRVVSTKCLMSLNGHLLRPIRTSPPCLSFTRFIVEQCLLKKISIWPLLTRLSPSAQYCRHQTYSGTLKNSFSPRTIPHWNSLSPSVTNTEELRALLI